MATHAPQAVNPGIPLKREWGTAFAALRRLLANGAKLKAFSPAIMDACYKEAMALHAEIAKENPTFKKVNDSLTDFSKNGYLWHQVAELGYDSYIVRQMRG